MKIITVNLPVSDIKMIKGLVGENGLYPSRSELIRVAIRDFLVKELDMAKNFESFRTEHVRDELLEEEKESDFVRVPVEKTIGMETIKEWKTYKIIHK
jgi:Arc/MetJ-type ribon-helix-helix transcriptional regulator